MLNNKQLEGIMSVQLDSYLRKLRAVEMRKPAENRRPVPTMKELAKAAGVNPSTLSRISRGRTRLLNLDVIQTIFSEIWRRGFEMEPNDLLAFEPPPNLTPKKSKADDPWAPPPPPLTREQHRKYPGEEFTRAYEEN